MIIGIWVPANKVAADGDMATRAHSASRGAKTGPLCGGSLVARRTGACACVWTLKRSSMLPHFGAIWPHSRVLVRLMLSLCVVLTCLLPKHWLSGRSLGN